MSIDKPLTVADLIRALSKLPPQMELWTKLPWDNGFYPLTIEHGFPMDESAGLGVEGGKLVLVYDSILLNGEPLDFSEDKTDER